MNPITRLEILKLTYCGFSAKIVETNKVVYCWKFPPTVGVTKIPNMSTISSPHQLTPDSHIRRDTFVQFVSSQSTRQSNGKWKGGAWGTNNFTVTSTSWFPGMYIGDVIECNQIHQGIVKYSPKPFDGSETIIPNTEDCAFSCNGIWKGNLYAFYMTDNIMPQKATDKLWIWGSKRMESLRIKILRRGSGPDVDFASKIAPAAGEHLEPGLPADRIAQAIWTITQEINIPKSTLSKCFLIPLGKYSDDGRDPRYWTYSTCQDGIQVEFGIPRQSSTEADILYIETEDDVTPPEEEAKPVDQMEISKKYWVGINDIFDVYPESDWMLEDHMRFIPDSINCIKAFRALSVDEKAQYKM